MILKTVYLRYRELGQVHQGIFVNCKTVDTWINAGGSMAVALDTLHGLRVFESAGAIRVDVQRSRFQQER